MLGATLARSKTRSGLPKSRKRKGVVSSGAKREGIGPGAARRKTRMSTCTSTKMPTVPSTTRVSRRNGLVLDANMEISYLLIGRFPMRRYEYNARWLLEVCTELEGRNFLGGLPSAEYP